MPRQPHPAAGHAAFTRRAVLRGAGAGLGSLWLGRALADPQVVAIDDLKPGQFVWHPDRAPTGPVAIVVSLPDQRVYVYRNGVRIAVSTCSTGKPGHETPTGIFTILQKDKNHHSSTYNDAPMPNMNRLTWSGIALHAGNLPGYPASHGCVRLPLDFSAKLFTITQIGTPVIIANAATYPTSVLHPGMVLSSAAATDFDAAVAALKQKRDSGSAVQEPPPPPATSIMISGADKQIMVLDNGNVVARGKATITDPDKPLGDHVFILSALDNNDKDLRWETIGYYNTNDRGLEPSPLDTIRRIRADPTVVQAMRTRMYPGTVMVTVDLPLSADSRTGKDFVIMSDGAES
jgi:hypothetical protein